MGSAFWTTLDALIQSAAVVIDRPKGSAHPRYGDIIYPLDYGFLQDTCGGDGREIDLWRGSLPSDHCDSVVCTIDLVKRDAEIKLLLGCNDAEKRAILAFHNSSRHMSALLIEREVQ